MVYVAGRVIITNLGLTASPAISVASGMYTQVQSVTLNDATPGAIIYYTTDGSAPTIASTVYSGAITVGTSTILKSIASAPGYTLSPIAAATYTINLQTQSAGGAKTADHQIRIFDPGNDKPYLAQYNGLTFELSRFSFSRHLENDFKKKPGGNSAQPQFPAGGGGFPGLQ